MPGFGVCRANADTAGGTILVGNPYFFVDGFPVSVEGNPVQDHGNNEHDDAIMVQGNPNFTVGGIPVCTIASQASCGHQPTGSSTFFVG
jgi:uncharacterized Zn-binding protein involved in type VI secretion